MGRTVCIYLFSLFLLTLVEVAWTETYPLRNYTEKNGLSTTTVNCIYQDSRGYVWFGTNYGISRFDGRTFRNYKKEDGLADNYIISIAEDGTGNLWIGTPSGLSCFYQDGINGGADVDGADVRFQNYMVGHGPPANRVTAITKDKAGLLWFATPKGLSRFDGKRFKNHTTVDGLYSNEVTGISADNTGKLWVAVKGGIGFMSEGVFNKYLSSENMPHSEGIKILADSMGRLWLGSNNGLSRLKNGKLTSYTVADGLCHNHVSSIEEDSKGNIWIGTWDGLSVFTGETFRKVTSENGLLNNFINSTMEDREGNMWIASRGGVSCLLTLNIGHFSKKDGLANNVVTSIVEDRYGQIWMGTDEGLCRYGNKTFTTYTRKNGLAGDTVCELMEEANGNLWIATIEGISIHSRGTFTNYTTKDGLASNIVFTLWQDRKGMVWAGNRKGLNRFDRAKKSFTKSPIEVMDNMIVSIFEDSRGDLWLSSNGGLFRYSGKTTQHFTILEGLPSNIINGLQEDKLGRVWIGTDNGLSCYDGKTFTNYSTRDGLPGNICNFILEDSTGRLWIGTVNGLACFNGKTFKRYTAEAHGLTGNYWSNGFRDKRGTFWLGSQYGVTRFSPPPIEENRIPPPIYLTGVKVHEEKIPLSTIGHLQHNHNHLKLEFAGLCFRAPDSVIYRYRLEGIGKGWLETQERFVSYPYLPPGRYRFLVKAVNNDGIESETPLEINFAIQPPYWATWWFRAIIVLAIFSMILVIVLWRIKRTREKAILEERTRQLVMAQRMELMGTLATGAVHDLKNLLGVILGYSQIADSERQNSGTKTETKNESAAEIIRQIKESPNEVIKKTAGTALQVVKQILAFARNGRQKTELTEPVELLTNLLETLTVTTKGEIDIQWNPPQPLIVLPVNPVRFQQLVMNLCLNSVDAMPEGGQLVVSLCESEDKSVVLEITDTGMGMDEYTLQKIFEPLYTTKDHDKGTGLGLFVVKRIVGEFGGEIDVKSQPGSGSTFRVTFPENTAHLLEGGSPEQD